MKFRWLLIAFTFILSNAFALQPDQILVIANSDVKESIEIAQYYFAKRAVPVSNILTLKLGAMTSDEISRQDYDKLLAEPIRHKLTDPNVMGKIRCLVTIYGVPVKVGPIDPLKDQQSLLIKLQDQLKQTQVKVQQANLTTANYNEKQKEYDKYLILDLQSRIDRINSKETNAAVDSELSMVLFADYDKYRWQKNWLSLKMPYWDFKSLMVCRLDGPSGKIAKGLIDKAIRAEKNGLKGTAYIDSGFGLDKEKAYKQFDEYLLQLAESIRFRNNFKVVEEKTKQLFVPGTCPNTAIYCGWYSLKKYVDAFDFVPGAIGYHIASWEAIDIRNPKSTAWCPSMLIDGVTATIGPVAEPYLNAFPQPNLFFNELFEGSCLVEAYYHTNPFNSWQMILIGDPLYTPFPKSKI